jgi:hypothetical protein
VSPSGLQRFHGSQDPSGGRHRVCEVEVIEDVPDFWIQGTELDESASTGFALVHGCCSFPVKIVNSFAIILVYELSDFDEALVLF